MTDVITSNPNESILTRVLFAFLLIISAQGRCMLYQAGITDKARAPETEAEQTPAIYAEGSGVCEDFVGKPVCCTETARTLMMINFTKLLFASPCQSCLNNLKRFLYVH